MAASTTPPPRAGLPQVLLVTTFPALVIALLAACGGSGADDRALALAKRSNEAMGLLESYRSQIDIKGQVDGERVDIVQDFQLAKNDWFSHSTGLDTPEGWLEVHQVVAPPHLYLNVPDYGVGWVRGDLAEGARASGIPASVIGGPPPHAAPFLFGDGVPWDLYAVTSLGPETLDGVPVTRVGLEVDFVQVRDQLTPEARAAFGRSFGSYSDLVLRDSTERVEFDNVALWIDDSALVHKYTMSMAVGDAIDLDVEARFRDHDEDIAIDTPEEFLVIPPPEEQ